MEKKHFTENITMCNGGICFKCYNKSYVTGSSAMSPRYMINESYIGDDMDIYIYYGYIE